LRHDIRHSRAWPCSPLRVVPRVETAGGNSVTAVSVVCAPGQDSTKLCELRHAFRRVTTRGAVARAMPLIGANALEQQGPGAHEREVVVSLLPAPASTYAWSCPEAAEWRAR